MTASATALEAYRRIDFGQQTAIFDPTQLGDKVVVIGAGGIGGTLADVLASLGIHTIEYCDGDRVEGRNVASTTLFGPDDIGRFKVDVVADRLRHLGVPEVIVHQEHFDPAVHRDQLSGVVITALDSMAIRRSIWEGAIRDNSDVVLLLDGRTGGMLCQLDIVFPSDPNDGEWYEGQQLFDDAHAAQLECTARNIAFAPVALAAFVARTLARYVRGESLERAIYMHVDGLDIDVIERPAPDNS